MAKSKNYKGYNPADIEFRTKHALMNKYYNVFMNSMDIEGLDRYAKEYVMRKFWSNGTIAAFDMKNVGLAFAPYAVSWYGLYDRPAKIQLINERNIYGIPSGEMLTEQDAVIGYYQKNHKPVVEMVEYYVDRMVDILMSISTNIQTSKIPFLIGTSVEDKAACDDVINKIVNNDIAIFMKSELVSQMKALNNGSNYIVDKLWDQYLAQQSELMTYLGIDNSYNATDYRYSNEDETNANNVIINVTSDGYESELKEFAEEVSRVLGYTISFKTKYQPAESETAKNVDNEELEND